MVYIRDAHITGHFTKYFSNELNPAKDLAFGWLNGQTETEPKRVDIEIPNANNAESPYLATIRIIVPLIVILAFLFAIIAIARVNELRHR